MVVSTQSSTVFIGVKGLCLPHGCNESVSSPHRWLLRFMRPGNCFTTINLKDAHCHVPICPIQRKSLRFHYEATAYDSLVLPFGLSLSLCVFSQVVKTALAPMRGQWLRVLAYLDDWLIAAESREQAVLHTSRLVSHVGEHSTFLPVPTPNGG